MHTKYRLHMFPKSSGDDTVPKVRRSRLTLLFITLTILALAAPLLLTLPRTLDAAVSLPPAASAPAMAASERPFHEQHPMQATTSWEDSLEQTELATWRARASD
jgi:hypothetical protein